MRIVSLVPSLTELVIDLDLDNEVVGRTKFCIHPAGKVKYIPKIGGTKNIKISKVAALNPDLILANKEENTKEDVEALQEIASVCLTDISNFSDAIQTIEQIGTLTNRIDESKRLIERIKAGFSELVKYSAEKKSVCYLIWKNPLMTIGQDTYIHDMLAKCGFVNVFSNQRRYPIVSTSDIQNKKPDFIFLSSEPFPFKDKHIQEFKQTCPESKVILVDGEFFSWYGSRMRPAAEYFKKLIIQLQS